MGRNHLNTGRKGPDVKESGTDATGSKPRLQQGCGSFPPQRREVWTPDRAPEHRATVSGSAAYVATGSERLQSFSMLGREGAH